MGNTLLQHVTAPGFKSLWQQIGSTFLQVVPTMQDYSRQSIEVEDIFLSSG